MKTYHKDHGCTASITDCRNSKAILRVRDAVGRLVWNKTYRSRRAAIAAWAAMCR